MFQIILFALLKNAPTYTVGTPLWNVMLSIIWENFLLNNTDYEPISQMITFFKEKWPF